MTRRNLPEPQTNRQRLLKTFMDLDVPPELCAEITRPMRDKTDEEKERMAGEAIERLLSKQKIGASPERYAITNDGFSQTGEAPSSRTPEHDRAIGSTYYILLKSVGVKLRKIFYKARDRHER